jgi:phage terminase small subunit
MKPPNGLGREGRAAWQHGERVLMAIGENPELAAETLGRYAIVADELAHAHEAWIKAGRPLTATGSAGQEQPHPLLRVERELRAQALDLEAALGANPAARASMRRRPGGLGVGHAPDRRPQRPGKVTPLYTAEEREALLASVDP